MKLKTGLVCGLLTAGVSLSAMAQQVLTWNPGAEPVWDLSSVNWLDGATPTAWVPGAVAVFGGSGGFVEVRSDVSAGGLTFSAGKYALVGGGRIRLEGYLDVAGGMTNSVGVELVSDGGIAKTGAGVVALGRRVGRVTVAAGDLLAAASDLSDAEVDVASGARLVTAGEPERGAANLIENGGFEAGTIANGVYQYVNNGANLPGWGVWANPGRVALQNIATTGTAWSSAGMAPEGAQVLILQFSGAVTQAVTVAQAGWHQVAFSHFLRRDYPEIALYVTLDGMPVTTVLNDAVEGFARRFVSVPFWLEPGVYVLGLASEAFWSDRTSMVDDVCFGVMSAGTACQALGGESSVTLAGGAEAVLDHAGNLGVARLDVGGGATVSGNGTWGAAPTGLWYEYASGLWTPPLVMGPSAGLRIKDSSTLMAGGLAQRIWVSDTAGSVTLNGTGLTLTNTVPVLESHIFVPGTGAMRVTAPLTLRQRTTFDVFGALAVEGFLDVTNAPVSKRGFGAMSIDYPLWLLRSVDVLEGRLSLAHVYGQTTVSTMSGGGGGYVWVLSQPGRTTEMRLPLAGVTHTLGIAFGGSGRNILTTDVNGGVVTIGHPRTVTEKATEFHVPGNDTLSLRQLLIWTGTPSQSGGWLKSGSGTLEIKEGGYSTSNDRAHNGRPILRNGTVRVLVDDTGNFTGALAYNDTSPDGRGGSLGAGPLTAAVWIGDAETLPTDNLTFVAVGNKRFIGHDFEVFNFGDAVRFEMEDSTETMFAGTFTLHRGVTFSGAAGAHLIVGGIATAAGNSGAVDVALEGFSQITITNTLSADINLDVGTRALSIGSVAATASTLRSFTMAGGTFSVAFEGGACTRIDAETVTLGTVAFDLRYRDTDTPFSEPGTYTLMTSTGAMTINPANLSVANEEPGFTYIFNVSGNALTVTIQYIAQSAYAVWSVQQGGAWDTGNNWHSGTVPNDSAISVLFGAAIAEDATVTLEAPFSVGPLTFNHTTWGYTLAGDTLTLGSPARLDVLNGSHTIKNTLDASEPLSITTTNGMLTVDSGTIIPQVLLEQGTLALAGEAALPGGASLAEDTAMSVTGTNSTIGTSLSGMQSTTLTLQDKGKLTVTQTANGIFGGQLNGANTAELIKSGAGAWQLEGHGSIYEGMFRQEAGETMLAGVSLLGAVEAEAGSTLTVAPVVTNGLMGYYYIGNPQANSNAFLSIAGLEAYVAGRKPDLIAPSGLDDTTFSYPLQSGAALTFPYPFGGGGPNTVNFTAVWRGSITVPETGAYGFAIQADDFVLVAIDGTLLYAVDRYIGDWQYRSIDLAAGRHDILIGLGQVSGNAGIRLYVFPPSHTSGEYFAPPNTWLTPMPAIGSLNSKGTVMLENNANMQVGSKGAGLLSGRLEMGTGSFLEKIGQGLFEIRGSVPNSPGGDVSVRAGKLVFANPGQLGPASHVTVYDGAAVAMQASQTLGSISGRGHTLLGSGDMGVDVFAFTDETDSGISPTKHYTHLVDMPLGQETVATVNGVTFNKSANWSYIAGTGPNQSQTASSETGIERLLRGFVYGQRDYTFRLTGLLPFEAYEFRFYFRNYGNPLNEMRDVTLSFALSGNSIGEVRYSLDSIPRSQVRCRYITDATGTLDVRVFSHTGDTAHIYAFSNEALVGDGFSAAAPTLTLAPSAGTDARYAGSFSGNGTLVKSGAGIQRFSGRNSLADAFTVQSGEATLERGAVIVNAPTVEAGARLSAPLGGVTLGGLMGNGTFCMSGAGGVQQGTIYQHFFTNDATSLISSEKVYTHKLDFGSRAGDAATVNGVAFVKAGMSGTVDGYGWSGFGASQHAGNSPSGLASASESVYNLLFDMTYNAGNLSQVTAELTGLTPGKQYEVRIYQRIWATSASRRQTVSFIPDPAVINTITFNEDKLPPNFLAYRYTPTSTTLTIKYEGTTSGATWHFYGLTNEEVTEEDANAVVFDMKENATFSGTATGWQFWKKRGNGAFLMTGINTATGPLAIEGGAFGVGAGGVATLGPVSVRNGLLFGQGTVGGTVDVAPGAWLQAGTASACGALAIGGDLLIAPDANIKFRYTSVAQADTFTVGGVLTLPDVGVVTAEALVAGAASPMKWPLFSTSTVINGPEDFSAWTIDGLPRATLVYSPDRTKVYVREARGTLLLLL